MIRKKKTWLAAAFATTMVLGAVVWLCWPTERAITIDMYHSIRIGMTPEEVQDLLEAPGGSRQDFVMWAHQNHRICYGVGQVGKDLLNEHRDLPGVDRHWYGGEGVIVVRFGPNGASTDKQFLRLGEFGRSFRQKVRKLLGW